MRRTVGWEQVWRREIGCAGGGVVLGREVEGGLTGARGMVEGEDGGRESGVGSGIGELWLMVVLAGVVSRNDGTGVVAMVSS